VIVATCGTPSESQICTDAVNVEPVAAFASRLLIVFERRRRHRRLRTPGGTTMLVGTPVLGSCR
jgi:hypothetical protein